jgi:hypothetical protein
MSVLLPTRPSQRSEADSNEVTGVFRRVLLQECRAFA